MRRLSSVARSAKVDQAPQIPNPESKPRDLARDDSLEPITNPHEQRAAIVNTGRVAGLRSICGLPCHPGAMCPGCPFPQCVEDNIEPAVEEISVSPRQMDKCFREEHGAVDMAAQLGFERCCAIGEIRRIGHRADVDSVSKHDTFDSRGVRLWRRGEWGRGFGENSCN